jgi:hypothetical protein
MIQSDRPGGEQTGRSQRTQKLEIAELNPQRASSSRDFLCRIWYLCWNLTGLMEERGELPKQLSRRKKPGARIAGHSETSILGHPGRFEYSARQSELRFLSGTNSHGLILL